MRHRVVIYDTLCGIYQEWRLNPEIGQWVSRERERFTTYELVGREFPIALARLMREPKPAD
jgi:hypothetical protein